MQFSRPLHRRSHRAAHLGGNRGEPSQASIAAGNGLPHYLSGARRIAHRNFGSGHASLEPPASENRIGQFLEVESPLPTIAGEGMRKHATAYGLTLQGRTDATYNNTFATEAGQARPAKGCTACAADECIRATGTVASTFHVATTVTLPSVDDFPGLTACQRARVQTAIASVLAPHEQQHVAAFQTYNGTVRTPFNLTLCRADFDARIQALHDGIADARRASAQALSDALDPFDFEVDLNCQEPPPTSTPDAGARPGASAGGGG